MEYPGLVVCKVNILRLCYLSGSKFCFVFFFLNSFFPNFSCEPEHNTAGKAMALQSLILSTIYGLLSSPRTLSSSVEPDTTPEHCKGMAAQKQVNKILLHLFCSV